MGEEIEMTSIISRCIICGQFFDSKWELRDHKDKVHRITNSKMVIMPATMQKPINYANTAVKGYCQEEIGWLIDWLIVKNLSIYIIPAITCSDVTETAISLSRHYSTVIWKDLVSCCSLKWLTKSRLWHAQMALNSRVIFCRTMRSHSSR